MTPREAIITCLKKSVSFKGRASRSEFWWFVPIGVLSPILLLMALSATGLHILIVIPLIWLSALPLFAVGSRRLQDTGEAGEDAYKPWAFFAIFALLASFSFKSGGLVEDAFASDTPPDGPAGLAFTFVYFWGGTVLIGVLALISLVVFLIQITPAFAQTLVPSQPGPNKYGPNPNEVTP